MLSVTSSVDGCHASPYLDVLDSTEGAGGLNSVGDAPSYDWALKTMISALWLVVLVMIRGNVGLRLAVTSVDGDRVSPHSPVSDSAVGAIDRFRRDAPSH